jgi:PKD repeat protein
MRIFAAIAATVLLAACQPVTGLDSGRNPAGGGSTPNLSYISVEPARPVVGETVTFGDLGLFADSGYTRRWSFGDGASAEGASVTHTFSDLGTYTVTLDAIVGDETRSASIAVTVGDGAGRKMPPEPQMRRP